jgi:hypothetical protein
MIFTLHCQPKEVSSWCGRTSCALTRRIDEAFMSVMLPKSMALRPGDSFEGFSIHRAETEKQFAKLLDKPDDTFT